ncbi:serine/threonine protein kinase [Mangrovactinospora gilvigrisea]|uniref:non-specific serine/threonine protein kinase n=1 Tax=Mangrovactinospora gilvigrisea TaxID=1428644 RepID=A0A1J7BF35_9ACTN|nr:Stk1 family PASTA domain-containing Ser/Thr kinase [Mangrovactinospora gilvigrisea]OIV37254.1 serine/threonine protein kinase [Mangrovactinospora gilvigrisea]
MEEPRRLGGRYELGAVLGRGGMAEVHIGHDIRLGRTVAVKTLRADMARDPVFQARFRREAQSAASLNHPSIVAVYDTGEDYVDGVSLPYIVMEYVDGSTLRDLLHSGRRLLPERAMEMTAGILSALEYSHRNGIVHRDIKPANVMLTRQGTVKVMDFGIARAMADTGGITMTQTQSVIGTAQYLSPEQARGETVDARSDLYSTGCVLFELLTLRPPFVGDTPVSVAYQHVREMPQPPSAFDPEITPALDAIVLKSLAKGADERYQSADEFRADLERALDGLPVEAAAGMGAGGYGAEAATAMMSPQAATAMMPRSDGGPGTAMMPPVEDDGDGYGDGGRSSRRQQKKKGRGSTVLLVIAALLVIAGAYLVGRTFLSGNSPAENNVKAPNLVGESLSDARTSAVNTGVKLARGSEEYCAQDKGAVCRQSPAAGADMKRGGTVTVVVSKGSRPISMPDLKGKTVDEAMQILADKGFDSGSITKNTQENTTVPNNTVLSSDPPAGQQVPKGSKITLTVATQPATSQVPDVTNQDKDTAAQAIRKAGFTPAFVYAQANDPTKVANTVVSENPGQGSTQQKGTTVTLTLNPPGNSPNPTNPTPSPTPTDTSGDTGGILGGLPGGNNGNGNGNGG